MKKLIILIVILLSTTSILFAQKTPFEKFDKSRIDVGTMYVYEYSKNKEDFEPSSKEYLYIKTLNDIEIMWFSIKDTISTLTLLEKYKMNWDYMMFERSEWQGFINKNKMVNNTTLEAKGNINFVKKELKYNGINKVKDRFKKWSFVSKFESIPTYFYRLTDLMPLWFALRFYPLGKEKITVNSLTGGYNVNMDVKYEGKEEVEVPFGKVLSYKFELVPQLSFFMKLFHSPKKVFIWLTSEDSSRYMVKYRNNNERSTFTQSMEYRLAERKKMTLEEWEQFKEKHIAKDTNSTN
ncbi:MAG TPA: DUF3108 domain-containing protein [Ignavibacteria bacterium]|nr:DUF3108 domain-containing protein [Ignavibacteria bacterium]